MAEAFATKNKEWKYENEVRLITYDVDETSDFTKTDLCEGDYIAAIYFGLKCPETAKTLIRKILHDNSDVKFYDIVSASDQHPYELTTKECS